LTEQTLNGIKYCLYARKSSEVDERQALSIDSQIKEMLAVAKRDGLEVVETLKESHSAKDSGQRPVFAEIMEEIKAGKFNGILTWAADRISRNAGDLGTVVDLMDAGKLTEIRTPGQIFHNSPNEKFLLMILCSQAKLENDNRGVNVKRGLKNKVEMGWRPGTAPIGYLNDIGKHTIYIDQERTEIVKEAFRKIAEDGCTGREIFDWMQDDIKFETRTGKSLALSGVYLMLKNPFYYGKFEYPADSGKWYDGSHEPLITKERFDAVQARIATGVRKGTGRVDFAFIRLMTCAKCGTGITAEEKFKKFKNGTIKRYVYYHCTGGRNRKCKSGFIREESLVQQFLDILDMVALDKNNLRQRLQDEIDRFNRFAFGVLKLNPEQLKTPKIDVRKYAKYVLREGSPEEKREILNCIDHKLVLDNGRIQLI
jgi:DNA invertase Pin-like site-specific DNA recombinase